jgi:hypothetical protein
MTFEQQTKDYIVTLKNDGIIIDMDIYGVNEQLRTSSCIGRFLNGDVVEERYVIVYEINNTITWSFLKPVDTKLEND